MSSRKWKVLHETDFGTWIYSATLVCGGFLRFAPTRISVRKKPFFPFHVSEYQQLVHSGNDIWHVKDKVTGGLKASNGKDGSERQSVVLSHINHYA